MIQTRGRKNKMKPRVRWDEENLSEIQAKKPVSAKIVEPKTPYHPMIEEDGTLSPVKDFVAYNGYTAHAEAVKSALDKVVSSHKQFRCGEQASSKDETDDLEHDEDVSQAMSFEAQRKAHYDEFLKVKQLGKQKEPFLDTDDDNNNNGKDDDSYLTYGMREVYIADSNEMILRTVDIQERPINLPAQPPSSTHSRTCPTL